MISVQGGSQGARSCWHAEKDAKKLYANANMSMQHLANCRRQTTYSNTRSQHTLSSGDALPVPVRLLYLVLACHSPGDKENAVCSGQRPGRGLWQP
jgi:hypothetical protein